MTFLDMIDQLVLPIVGLVATATDRATMSALSRIVLASVAGKAGGAAERLAAS